jgi:hypothetical protein
VATDVLRLQHEARKRYLPFIAREFPELAGRYARTYAQASVPGEQYRQGLSALLERLRRAHGLHRRRYGGRETGADVPPGATSTAVADIQLVLPL